MGKVTLASDWLDVCSGCHMAILDIDERIVELIKHVDIHATPVTDFKHPPKEGVDVGILTGAVSNHHQVEQDTDLAGAFHGQLNDLAAIPHAPTHPAGAVIPGHGRQNSEEAGKQEQGPEGVLGQVRNGTPLRAGPDQ